ncbi:uncharacterized protein BDR25DRAFT_363832 [Lindgomyces ingoldianus]|uniref:Uncharacterized protein n=1 Tax=Lindgomyces ingoldianus TaxID=673940 RepID=A0ACB6Q6V2_9PLEO|nr:uncharacterized protein BDR25DRAFT_363832 [Lindgomyces ingoldianus]KAF2462613.1 hypothetical protein BDR25DRAFT_363832 [Lindgomyces ingoldianus]
MSTPESQSEKNFGRFDVSIGDFIGMVRAELWGAVVWAKRTSLANGLWKAAKVAPAVCKYHLHMSLNILKVLIIPLWTFSTTIPGKSCSARGPLARDSGGGAILMHVPNLSHFPYYNMNNANVKWCRCYRNTILGRYRRTRWRAPDPCPWGRVQFVSVARPDRNQYPNRSIAIGSGFERRIYALLILASTTVFQNMGIVAKCSPIGAEEGSYGKRVNKVVRSKQGGLNECIISAVHGYDIA